MGPVRRVVVAVLAVALAAAGGEFVVGFPRFYEGRVVRRHTAWFYLTVPFVRLPRIPYAHATTYYYYHGGAGQRVQHGRYTRYHANRRLDTTGVYRHGAPDGRWVEYDSRGWLESETVWRNGRRVGWGNYVQGKIEFYQEDLFAGDEMVAVKRFEGGRWTLTSYPGCPRLFAMEPATGETRALPARGSPPYCVR